MSSDSAYSWADRALHRVAFSMLGTQATVSDLEDRIFANRLKSVETVRPVFITALPRAGTTLLLEILAGLPDFATHSYRNLPFLLCPVLWSEISRPFQLRADARERSHGDGMLVDYDSPEALEEIIWKQFWPAHYGSDRIDTWSDADRDDEFETFLRNHMRKIVALGDREGEPCGRYLSKNNANCARIELLRVLFPDCTIVVPLRKPMSQIASLRAQHQRFAAIHDRDRFALNYMQWLGHHEFGRALKPLNFGGWLDGGPSDAPDTAAFWAKYWVAWARMLLGTSSLNVCLFDYDLACRTPRPMLSALAAALDIRSETTLCESAARFREPTDHGGEACPLAPELRDEVEHLYGLLRGRAAIDISA